MKAQNSDSPDDLDCGQSDDPVLVREHHMHVYALHTGKCATSQNAKITDYNWDFCSSSSTRLKRVMPQIIENIDDGDHAFDRDLKKESGRKKNATPEKCERSLFSPRKVGGRAWASVENREDYTYRNAKSIERRAPDAYSNSFEPGQSRGNQSDSTERRQSSTQVYYLNHRARQSDTTGWHAHNAAITQETANDSSLNVDRTLVADAEFIRTHVEPCEFRQSILTHIASELLQRSIARALEM